MFDVEYWSSIPTRWMSDNASLLIYSDDNRTANVTFRAVSFSQPRTLEIYNGGTLQTTQQVIPTSFVNMSAQFLLQRGENTIHLHIPEGCERPSDIPELNSTDHRCLSIAVQNLTIS